MKLSSPQRAYLRSLCCPQVERKLKIITYNLNLIMTTWLGDKYEGEYKEGWYHGYGKLELDNGIVY
jgi:hypothetical protein